MKYARKWCVECKCYTHHKIYDQMKCCCCDNEYKEVPLKDIPRKKKVEQRKRYLESILDFYKRFADIKVLFSNDSYISEDSAGYERLQKILKKRRDHKLRLLGSHIKEYKEMIFASSKLGRNDKCFCGSNKKFKKCCIDKIEQKALYIINEQKRIKSLYLNYV